MHLQLGKRAGRLSNTNRLLRNYRLLAQMLPFPLLDGIGCPLTLRIQQLSRGQVRIIRIFMAH